MIPICCLQNLIKIIVFSLTLLDWSRADRLPSECCDRFPEELVSPPGDKPAQETAHRLRWGHTAPPSLSHTPLWVSSSPGSDSAPWDWSCSCERGESRTPPWSQAGRSGRLVWSPGQESRERLITILHLARVVNALLPGDGLALLLGNVPALHPAHLLTAQGVVPRHTGQGRVLLTDRVWNVK